MNVGKVMMAQQPSFSAKTKIHAPESLLSEEDREYFEELGAKIGKDTDTIEITISEPAPSKMNPNVSTYKYSEKATINGLNKITHLDIPYIKENKKIEKTSPKNYLQRIFDRMM